MRRLSLEISGVRPPLWPAELLPPLRQLRGFRLVVTHAYDLSLDRERLRLILRDASQVVMGLRPAIELFLAKVERTRGEET